MEKRIDGHTGLLALFGTPVGHSGSPAMYNFCFQHDGLNLAYMAFDVDIPDMEQTLSTVKLWNLRGGNFTMPCKNIAAELMDELSDASKIIGACNVFVNKDGKLYGDVTDGKGFIKNLSVNGIEIKGKKLVVLGAGGAATAIEVQAALDGAAEIAIFNRDDEFYARAEGTVEKLKKETPDVKVSVTKLEESDKLAEAVNNCDILINATSVGMKPMDGQSLIDTSLLRKDLVVADTVYNPEKTQLILDAEEAGCAAAIGGKGMLLWQGALNYELFVGKEMPVEEYQAFQAEQAK
ncbi:MAG TPA: shikimate dehydrogenase [Candidatus Fimousia stercorigallinarum]|nr:shikimate dehydrogenase [Candidatus Fimousia stercorigallinarum]